MAFIMLLLVGLPVLLILNKLKLNKWYITIPLGSLFGYGAFSGIFSPEHMEPIRSGIFFTLNGAVAGGACWYYAQR